MKFSDCFAEKSFPVSFEFFPPKKAEGIPRLQETMRELALLQPAFMTVTYGAGGSTRGFTQELTSFIHKELGIPAVSHLTCVGHSKAEIAGILEGLKEADIRNILALRGDPPQGADRFVPTEDGFSCARDLCRFITESGNFSCAVAGYPETHREAESPESDLLYLKEKVDSGAEIVITQLFFDADHYFRFCEKAKSIGIQTPIVPGIMPISNVDQLTRFTSMCGASIPKSLFEQLDAIRHDDEAVLKFGQEEALRLAKKLKEGGAPGLHLYTLNKVEQVRHVVVGLS